MLGVERYAVVPQALLSKDMLNGQSLRVYSALAMHANDDSRAWPSLATLAKLTGLNRSNIQRILRKLEHDAIILTFPSASPSGTTIYELQPDPRVYLDTYATEESGPGGYLCSIAYTGLACLVADYPGIRIAWRARKANETSEAIEHRAADEEPILTPGIKLFFQNEHLIIGDEAWAAQYTLDGFELWLASGMIPWSVLACCVFNANERPVKRTPQPVVSDTTPAVTDTTGCSV